MCGCNEVCCIAENDDKSDTHEVPKPHLKGNDR